MLVNIDDHFRVSRFFIPKICELKRHAVEWNRGKTVAAICHFFGIRKTPVNCPDLACLSAHVPGCPGMTWPINGFHRDKISDIEFNFHFSTSFDPRPAVGISFKHHETRFARRCIQYILHPYDWQSFENRTTHQISIFLIDTRSLLENVSKLIQIPCVPQGDHEEDPGLDST